MNKSDPNLFNIDLFECFWKAYPKKVGKLYARQCFKRKVKNFLKYTVILKAVEMQKKSEEWKNRKYIPNPSTWLNGEKWEDELTYKETMTEQHARLKAKGKI